MDVHAMPSAPQVNSGLPLGTASTGQSIGAASNGAAGSGTDLFASLMASLLGQAGGMPGMATAGNETPGENLDAGAVTAGGGSEPNKGTTDAAWLALNGQSWLVGYGATAGAGGGAVEADNGDPGPLAGAPGALEPVVAGATSAEQATRTSLQASVTGGADALKAAEEQVPTGSPVPTIDSEAPAARVATQTAGPSVGQTSGQPVPAQGDGAYVAEADSAATISETRGGVSAGPRETAAAGVVRAAADSVMPPAGPAGEGVADEAGTVPDGFAVAKGDIVRQTVRVDQAPKSEVVAGESSKIDGRSAAQGVFAAGREVGRAREAVGPSSATATEGEAMEAPGPARPAVGASAAGHSGQAESSAFGWQHGGESSAAGDVDAEDPRQSSRSDRPTGDEMFEIRGQAQLDTPIAERAARTVTKEQAPERLRLTSDEFLPAIKKALPAMTEGARSEMEIQLVPEHLGKVTLKVSVVDGVVSAKFNVENGAVRQLVENRLPELRQALESQGLKLDTVNVGLGADTGTFGGAFSQAEVPDERRFGRALKGYGVAEQETAPIRGGTQSGVMQASFGGGRGSLVDALA